MKKTFALVAVCASLGHAQTNLCRVTVRPDTVVVREFLGFGLVNRNAEALPVRLQIPQGPRLTLRRYLYSSTSARTDAKGFPLALDQAEADLATGLDIPLPGNSVVFLTTLPQ